MRLRSSKFDMLTGAAAFTSARHVRAGTFRNRAERRRNKVADTAMNMQQQNDAAQAAILALAQPMSQPLAPVSPSGTLPGQVLTILPNNVGLNRKLIVEVTGTITAGSSDTLTRTGLGLANFFSNVTVTDLNNVQRVNTTGWHLYLLAGLRNRGPYAAAFASDAPAQMGSNYNVMDAPASIGPSQTTTFRIFYEIPLAYHDNDLRGAIYAAVTSAQWRLNLTINPNLWVGSAADATLAMYKSDQSSATATLSAVTIQVYQEYLDQLPRSGGNPILPALSLAYNYLLTTTTMTGMSAAADFPVFYPNYRTFLSTIAIYDQNGTLNTGSDINYLAVQVANLTYLQKWDPYKVQMETRRLMGCDLPPGVYALDHRAKPIDTNQYGNTSFVLNPSSAAASSSLMLGYEMLAIQSQAINAGSLQGG